eukprot:2073199-Amphidinium_carterae.1
MNDDDDADDDDADDDDDDDGGSLWQEELAGEALRSDFVNSDCLGMGCDPRLCHGSRRPSHDQAGSVRPCAQQKATSM